MIVVVLMIVGVVVVVVLIVVANDHLRNVMNRARILGKMDYFYFLRHMYETCL
jgi:hypothetical protein